jgi:hypothetical protein
MEDTRFCLKAYFQHPDDPRARLETEFTFISFFWERGVRALPEPMGLDRDHGIALYEYIPGRIMTAEEVNEEKIREALDLYRCLNRYGSDPVAQRLPEASESCFSLGEHIERVNFRVDRLSSIRETTVLDREAAGFVREHLVPIWRKVLCSFEGEVESRDLSLQEILSRSETCLSPSDFGFHNAILPPGGRLRFIDFEYAGWDDPAKLVCDFFCQPEVPVPLGFYTMVSEAVASGLTDKAYHLKRMSLLLPLYHIKWCCILLNDFLPIGGKRRRYAFGPGREEDRKFHQLAKAKKMLRRLEELGMRAGIFGLDLSSEAVYFPTGV